jgi:DNA/RNA-binding domain of Phe-tRNA-synthetase-like protein
VDVRIADGWRHAYPEASIGILALDGVENRSEHPLLAEHVQRLADDLRRRWAGSTRADLHRLPEFEAYRAYYRRFDKTYHVQLQFESVALKGKPLRGNGALVLAMFAAELQNRLLTAGHDRAAIAGLLTVDLAQGGEQYVGIGGRSLVLQPGDMYIRDQIGIISSVLYGPDDRTRITASTRQAVFCVYTPAGIKPASVSAHLDDIASNARLISPDAATVHHRVYP